MEENEKKAYISRSCYEAALEKLEDFDTQLMFIDAVIRYQLYGNPPYGLSGATLKLFDSILPDLKGDE